MAVKIARKPIIPIGITPTILCKFRDVQIVPHEAIDRIWLCATRNTKEDWEEWKNTPLVTTDGILAKITLVSTINNSDGSYDSFLDSLVKDVYGEEMEFSYVRKNWQARMKISDCWHLIRMKKDDTIAGISGESR